MKKFKKVLKFFGIIFSIFFVAIFLVFAVALIFSLTSKKIISYDSVNNYVSSIDFFKLPANDILGKDFLEDYTLENYLIDGLKKKGASEEASKKLIENSNFNEVTSEFLAQYVNYVFSDEEKPVFTISDMEKIASINDVEKELEISFNDKEKAKINKFLNDAVEQINKELPTREVLREDPNLDIFIKDFNMFQAKDGIIYMAFSLVLLYLLISLCLYSFYKPLMPMGIVTIFTGIIYVFMYLFQSVVLKKMVTSEGAIDLVVLNINGMIFKEFLISGIITFLIGVLMIILNRFIKRKISK